MATEIDVGAETRLPLNKERMLRAAVALADGEGVESLSMRNIAQALDVVPMALYRHVANKDEMLDGLVDVAVGEIDPPDDGADWKTALRRRTCSARRMLLRHPWAASRDRDAVRTHPRRARILRLDDRDIPAPAASRSSSPTTRCTRWGAGMLGFTQELFDDTPGHGPGDGEGDVRARWPGHIRTSAGSIRRS